MSIYISLGKNCLPRQNIYSNLKLTKTNGYKSCPFDLCQTPINSLIKCLKDDFKNFFTDLKLIPGINANGDRNNAGSGLVNITNSYGMIFNHESPTHSHLFNKGNNNDNYYIQNNYKEFKIRYVNRIENFYRYINDYKTIIFVINIDDNNSVDELYLLLKKKYFHKNIKLININKYYK